MLGSVRRSVIGWITVSFSQARQVILSRLLCRKRSPSSLNCFVLT